MNSSPNLSLPYLAAAQAQKHVTVNEALRALDALVQIAVEAVGVSVPPGSPENGQRWVVGEAPTSAWAGHAHKLAAWQDGAWTFFSPGDGWKVWDRTNARELVYRANVPGWIVAPGPDALGAIESSGASIRLETIAETISALTGAAVFSTIEIPARALVLAVSSKVQSAITGATAFDVGVTGQPTKFGGALATSIGSQNVGVIGPDPFYSATPIRLGAIGGNFTGGSVRVAIHFMRFDAPN